MCQPTSIFSFCTPAESLFARGVVVVSIGAIVAVALKALQHMGVNLGQAAKSLGSGVLIAGAVGLAITAYFFCAIMSRPIMPQN